MTTSGIKKRSKMLHIFNTKNLTNEITF